VKFELKEYQDEAAAKVLAGLRKGSTEYSADREFTAVSLSAPTGAGKTVIATAVIERLMFGDAETDQPGDTNAVFLWLTDDPSLNEQTRKKILEASERIQPAHLVTLDDSFDQPELDRGKVYFLNIQKLSRTSKLVVKKEGRRTTPLWATISTTIDTNGGHLYLVIDEAHRGTGKRSREDQTIAQRLMNGNGTVKAAPVVLGISATPERFDRAVAVGTQERLSRKVTVPISAVRESGLIKDVLSISYRGEAQTMETTLVRQAVVNLKRIDEAWNAYTEADDEPPVRPVLVLQIPPSASADDVGTLLDVCVEEWGILGHRHAMAHSLESHLAAQFGKHVVNYVKPQNIQDHPAVRLVIFKEALTTGWDCPRAEVMVSLRTAKDGTYIAQLIGRMVRAPLARRIESDERLNRVRLYLPQFDEAAVTAVKSKLESDEGGLPTDIELNSVDAPRNATVPGAAFAAIEALPSYVVPGPVHRSQVARLHKLAALLIGDGLIGDAIKVADEFLVSVLEAERARLQASGALDPLIADTQTAIVAVMDVAAGGQTISTETYATDIADVNRLFAAARRRFRDGLADKYWGHRVTVVDEDPYGAKVLTIAMSSDAPTVEKVEMEAAGRVRQWFDTHGDAISALSEDKKAKYAEVRAMAREPELVNPGLPTSPISMTGDAKIPAYRGHLYSDGTGIYRVRLGTWEQHVLSVETARDGFAAWYRNPSGGQRALRVPFETGGGYGRLYPDFVFLHADDEGTLRPSIVDPHGYHLADAGDKLRGLAAYAEKHGADFARIVGVIRTGGEFRLLDLKDPTIRVALAHATHKDGVEKVFAQHGAVYS
jgi:type III restriction enzyme